MNTEKVSLLLETLGSLSPEEAEDAAVFCESACSQISNRLKNPAYANEPAVLTACAATALYRYTLSAAVGENSFSSFKAGDVTVSRTPSAAAEAAEMLRDEAMLAAADFLNDIDFAFQAVDV